MKENRAILAGTGHALPQGVLTNADLEKIVETTDEWITSRTGIKERHQAAPDEYTSLFATAAARQALERREGGSSRSRYDYLRDGLPGYDFAVHSGLHSITTRRQARRRLRSDCRLAQAFFTR